MPFEPPPRGCLQHVRTVRALAAGGRRREWRRWLRRDGPRSRNVEGQEADQIAPGRPRVISVVGRVRVCLARVVAQERTDAHRGRLPVCAG